MGKQSDKVRLNVGGKVFETTATTLASAGRSSMFGAMFDDEWNLQPKRDENEEYFIDRNPDCFSVLLDLLRTGELYVPSHIPEKLFYREALYYGLLHNVRTAKTCKLDSNRLKLTSSVRGQDPGNCSAIRASPDGGCAVAHGGIVHVYDWMLEEYPSLHLEYQSINDVGWIDLKNIVISSSSGGMGLFSSSTGELRHRYKSDYEKDQVKSFAAGALCFDSDSKIFASYSGTSRSGIGMWDQVTGKQIDFFDSSDGFPFSDAEKIQWLNGRNCLFVSKLFPGINNKNYISILDFRSKRNVWYGTANYMRDKTGQECNTVDAIPMDKEICLVSNYEDLGFVDLRSTSGRVRWSWKSERHADYKHPKLIFQGGQLFCSMNDKISVYSCGLDQWVLTSRIGRSEGGSIRDFSIGGDRLFALHSEENVFDVWETPSAPII
ncbi:hypothetical protein MKX03_035875 [Papaver bracteatum]|nr:hypothetical protein MKX03_035875 [Papaver bracteatum]